MGHHPRPLHIAAPHGEIGEAVERHFLGMARPAQHHQLIFGHTILRAEVFRAHHVLIGHNPLDGRHDALVVELHFEALELRFEVGRRSDENERIGLAHHLVDVRREVDAVDGKLHRGEVGRIVFHPLKIIDGLFATHIPPDFWHTLQHDFGNSSCPRTTADDGNGSWKLCGAVLFGRSAETEKRTKTGHDVSELKTRKTRNTRRKRRRTKGRIA